MQHLVLIPGLGSDAAVWQRTIVALGGDFHCIVGDTLSDPTLPAMARRILDSAPPTFALAGVSMGGMVAMEIMRIAPSRVTHLALLGTNARADGFSRKLSRRLANLVVATGADFRSLATRSLPGLVHPAASHDVKAELVDMSVRVGGTTYRRQNVAVSRRKDSRSILNGIAVPTAVIVGQDDALLPVALSEEIHALTPGSTLHVIPDCGHLPPIEKPDVTAELLRALIGIGAASP